MLSMLTDNDSRISRQTVGLRGTVGSGMFLAASLAQSWQIYQPIEWNGKSTFRTYIKHEITG